MGAGFRPSAHVKGYLLGMLAEAILIVTFHSILLNGEPTVIKAKNVVIICSTMKAL